MLPLNQWTTEERRILFAAFDYIRHTFGGVGLLMWFWSKWLFAIMISISVITSMIEHFLRIRYREEPLGPCPSMDCKCDGN